MKGLLIALSAVTAAACATTGGAPMRAPLEPEIEKASFGTDTGKGNLLLIQPYLHANDHASDWLFSAKVENYLEVAKRERWIGNKTVVVLPAGYGTWLVTAGEDTTFFQARSLEDVRRLIANKEGFDYWLTMPFAPASDKESYAIFKLRSARAASAYHKALSKMAREYRVTLVGGSLILSAPTVDGGQITTDPEGPLFHVSYVFGPDGALLGQVRQVFPPERIMGFVSPGKVEDLPVVDTSAGKLGILLGNDAWYPEGYAALKEHGVELVVAPMLLPTRAAWLKPWPGHDGYTAPDDVDPADVGKLSYREAWHKYGLPARLSQSGADTGVAVYRSGRIWDQESDGQTTICVDGEIVEGAHAEAPVLVNLWLGSGLAATSQPAPEPDPVVEKAPPEAPSPEEKRRKKKAKKKLKGGRGKRGQKRTLEL